MSSLLHADELGDAEPWLSPGVTAQRPPRLLTLLGDYWWQRTGIQAQQRPCFGCSCGQLGTELVADGKGLVTDGAGDGAGDDVAGDDVTGDVVAGGDVGPSGADWDDAAGSDVAGGAEGTTIAPGAGEADGVVADVPGVPAGSLRAEPAAVRGPPAGPRPDTSSVVATVATIRRRTTAEAARAVRELGSSSRESMASRSLARPAGRA